MVFVRLNKLIGLAGVDERERDIARSWGGWLEGPMLLLAVWILLLWYLSATGSRLPPLFDQISNLVIWLFFVFETVLLTSLCANKKAYLSANWLNLLIIVAGIPILWGFSGYAGILRVLRLLLIFSLLFNASNTVFRVLSRHQVGRVLAVGMIFILMSGILIAGIDPAIETPWDGIWWAWVTVSTVGYGDIVPQSDVGRVFGAILILVGICLVSLFTAAVSAFFISKEEEVLEEKEDLTIQQLALILERIEGVEAQLQQLTAQKATDAEKSDPPET